MRLVTLPQPTMVLWQAVLFLGFGPSRGLRYHRLGYEPFQVIRLKVRVLHLLDVLVP